MSKGAWRAANKTFSDKHKELFSYLAEGKSDRDIADILGIRASTVYQRTERMMDIIKCAGRADLEAFCREVLEEDTQPSDTPWINPGACP
jgi:DNA-binding CsgD family transcriptional regulator